MKTLLKTPDAGNYTIEDYYSVESDYDFESTGFQGTKEEFIKEYENDEIFFSWQEMEAEYAWDGFMEDLEDILKKTRIKEAFCEVYNGGWRSRHGISDIFDLNAQNLINKVSVNGDYSLEIKKDGQRVYIVRYSHDEPTGATIRLHSSKNYNNIYNEVMGE